MHTYHQKKAAFWDKHFYNWVVAFLGIYLTV